MIHFLCHYLIEIKLDICMKIVSKKRLALLIISGSLAVVGLTLGIIYLVNLNFLPLGVLSVPQVQNPPSTTNWETYTNRVHGFTLKYSGNWHIKEFNDNPNSICFARNNGPASIIKACVISLKIYSPSSITLEEIKKNSRSDWGSKNYPIIIGGVEGLRSLGYGVGEDGKGYFDRVDFFTTNNTHYLLDAIYINDRNEFLEVSRIISGIVETFKFTI